jgi:L-fuconolactonase
MLIADSQVHLWGANTRERPWPKSENLPHRDTPLGPEEMLQTMDAAGVHRVVVVPPLWEGHRNDIAISAATRYPDRFSAMGRLDPLDKAARGTLGTWRATGLRGIRLSFRGASFVKMLEEGHADWIWGEAEKAGLVIYILIPHKLLYAVDHIAQKFPALKIVLNHLALTGFDKGEIAFRDFDKLLPLAKRLNIATSASSVPWFATDTYPFTSVHGYIRQAYDAFGPKRLFWGSDLTRSPCSYTENVTMFTEHLPWLRGEDKEWVMGRGLCEWLEWPYKG